MDQPNDTAADAIRFSVKSDDSPFVVCRLAPGTEMVAEPGAMMSMSDGIETRTVFGDGSDPRPAIVRFFKSIKRVFSGESMVSVIYQNTSTEPQDVYFAAPYPGTIMPVKLAEMGGTLICQRGAYLCGARGIRVGIAMQKKIRAGLFGGEGFILQKLEGDGLVFIHAGGTLASRDLQPGQTLSVDTGCIAALQPTVTYDIKRAGRISTMLMGGEGLFLTKLTGPGRVWIQSLPIQRLSASIVSNAMVPGQSKGMGRLYLILVIFFVILSLFIGDPVE